MQTICSVGDHVLYRDREHEVKDISFRIDYGYTASSLGALMYLLAEGTMDMNPNWAYAKLCTSMSPTVSTEPSIFEDPDYSLHLRELGESMLNWLDGLEARPDNNSLPEIITYLLAVQWDKEGGYGSSWCGKGEYRGIMSNIDRKYDRLDKIVNDEITGKRPILPTTSELTKSQVESIGESKIDAVADLANYCLLYLTWLRKTNPGAFKLWVDRNVPIYLHEKIPFIENYYR